MSHDENGKGRYPLGQTSRESVRTGSGRPLTQIDLAAVRDGGVAPEDLAIHAETLLEQAAIAHDAGFPQLAANLRRAAELTRIPNQKVLAIYEALRPYRVTHGQLLALADELEQEYEATANAELVREAAAIYKHKGLV